MPRQYGRQRARAVERSNQALQLWLHGPASYAEIGKVMGISRQRAGVLVRAALQRAMREHDTLAHTALQQELARVQVVLEEAYEVVLRDCPRCHGHGTRNSTVCANCMGTGYWHDVETRRKWMDTLLRAGEQRQRLLGLHVQQHQHQLVDEHGAPTSFQELLLRMPPEELDEEITNFLAASDAQRAVTAAVDATATTPPPEEGHASEFDYT